MPVIVPTEPGSIDHDPTAKGFKLVNDQAVPGGNKVYGTDAGGAKGWKDDPQGDKILTFEAVAGGSPIFGTGDLGGFVRVPSYLNGWDLDEISIGVRTAGIGGSMTAQFQKNGVGVTSYNLGSGVTNSGGTGVATAVATGDLLAIEITANTHTTPAEGMVVVLIFKQ